MNLITIMNIIFSIGGIIFFLFSLIIISKIKELFPGGKIAKKWLHLQILVIIFLIGYILNIMFIVLEMNEFIMFMTGIVYVFGGLFVFYIIFLSYKTYKSIISGN
ncbi:MAG: hypothetical protein ACP6IY_08735 [Promethearchaeia archaeon]